MENENLTAHILSFVEMFRSTNATYGKITVTEDDGNMFEVVVQRVASYEEPVIRR